MTVPGREPLTGRRRCRRSSATTRRRAKTAAEPQCSTASRGRLGSLILLSPGSSPAHGSPSGSTAARGTLPGRQRLCRGRQWLPRAGSLPPYPWRKARFPWKALGLSGRRRRGLSLGRIFYLGTHPIAMLIQLCILAFVIEIIIAWYALVIMVWALQVTCVTFGWLLRCATAKR